MKVLRLSVPIDHGELKMRGKTDYVMADPIAQHLATLYKTKVQKLEIFEPHYKPYMGQDLTDKKVCIWRTGGYGDILFITPIVEYLKRKYPTCKISVATSERFRDVWKNNPHISKTTSSFTLPIRLDFIKSHDYAGIFEGTIEDFKTKDQYCAIDSFAFTLGIFDMPLELKRPRYYLKSAEINVAKNRVRSASGHNIMNDPYFCVQWKSSSQIRDYPYEKMVVAMNEIYKETGYTPVILTHPNYRNIIEHEIRFAGDHVDPSIKEMPYINLAGVTSYRESAAVLALSSGLIGVDSSLTHLAAALGVPSVTVYGPFKGEWRTAYNPNNITLQKTGICENAPCAYHTKPPRQDGIPHELCTVDGKYPEFSREKFCRVMAAVQPQEIAESFVKLWEMQKEGKLPLEREFKCAL